MDLNIDTNKSIKKKHIFEDFIMRKSLLKQKAKRRQRRLERIFKRVSGTTEKPRLCVTKSLRHIYAQLIDDITGKTLMTVSTLSPDIRESLTAKKKVEMAKIVGELLAKKAKEIGVETVVFDRHGFKYHGRVKALADGARSEGKGLKF
jgi:large subunit ribosomal protein L18